MQAQLDFTAPRVSRGVFDASIVLGPGEGGVRPVRLALVGLAELRHRYARLHDLRAFPLPWEARAARVLGLPFHEPHREQLEQWDWSEAEVLTLRWIDGVGISARPISVDDLRECLLCE